MAIHGILGSNVSGRVIACLIPPLLLKPGTLGLDVGRSEGYER